MWVMISPLGEGWGEGIRFQYYSFRIYKAPYGAGGGCTPELKTAPTAENILHRVFIKIRSKYAGESGRIQLRSATTWVF